MWNLFPQERLRFWQNFRLDLDKLSKEQAIETCNSLWAFCPYQKYYLTWDQVDNWPNPWELLHENVYCDLARALGIMYTLYLTEHPFDIEIRVYNETSTKAQYNLVFIDKGKYVANYEHNTIVNKKQIERSLRLQRIITVQELQLDKLK